MTEILGNWKNGFLKEWNSPGPTIDAFMRSLWLTDQQMRDVKVRTAKKVRVLRGPIGSGKTTGVMGASVQNAQRQPKSDDGVRDYTLMVLRTDYRLMWSTFITPFWHKWFPENSPWTEWSGGKNQPADHLIRLNTPNGKLRYRVSFRALGEDLTPEDISNFFRGQLPNDVWLEEGDAFPLEVYQNAYGRVGRGTEMRLGGPVCPTLFISTNAPLIGTWMHDRIISLKWTPGVQYFNQPGGRSPGAENLHNLPPGYYDEQIAELDDWMVRRLVDNEFVLPRSGQPVYPNFRDNWHAVSDLEPDPNLDLYFGMDCGLDPALAVLQRDGDGQWRCLDEIAADHGTGSQRFSEMVNALLAQPRYERWNTRRHEIRCVVDPNAQWGVDKKVGELPWLRRVEKLTKIKIRPAKSNLQTDRKDAVVGALKRTVGTARPGFVVSYRCVMIRGGLGGLYNYGVVNLQGAGSGKGLTGEPVKNAHSHPVEALEYGMMEAGGLEDALGQSGQFAPKPVRGDYSSDSGMRDDRSEDYDRWNDQQRHDFAEG